MQYLVSKDSFTKITEPKGTIQNISKTLTIEVSETQTKNSGVLLPPMGKIQFDGSSVYARCVDGAGAEARVIPFEVVAKGGGGDGGVTADFSLDQAGTTIVENFKFSALEYPNATNPNLDGKTVLVMSVKDANATTSLVKYVFVDLAKLVGSSTNLKPSDNAIGISGASIGLNLSASAGNILSVADDGLYADLSVADGVSGNFAVIGESGAIVDGGFSFADLAELSAGKVFAGATSTAAGLSGLVPAPEAGDQTKFLRGDGTWAPVESGGASIAVFTGATSITGGLSGLVPAPAAGDESKSLRGDGTWSGEIILPTVASTVNGGFWLDVSGTPPAPKFYYDGTTYTFDVTVPSVPKRYRIQNVQRRKESDHQTLLTLYEYTDGSEAITDYTFTLDDCNDTFTFYLRVAPNAGQETVAPSSAVTATGEVLKTMKGITPEFTRVTDGTSYYMTILAQSAATDYTAGDGGTTVITIQDEGYEATQIQLTWQVSSAGLESASAIQIKG